MKYYPKFIALAMVITIILAIIALNRHFNSAPFQARRLLTELRMLEEPSNVVSEILVDIGFTTDVGRRYQSEIINDCVILGESAVPIYLPALDDDSERVRVFVALILRAMGSDARQAIPQLIQKIKENPDLDYQERLTNILSSIGVPAVAALQELASVGSEREKLLAVLTLSRINPDLIDGEFIQLYLDSLSSADRNIRLLGVNIVALLGPDAPDAVDLLIPLLNEPDREMQVLTARALASIGPPTVAHLIKSLPNEDQSYQIQVANILTTIDPNIAAEETLDFLIEIMQDDLNAHKSDIINIMTRMGSSARKAAPYLLAMVKSSDRNTQFRALEVLCAIKPNDSQTIFELMDMLVLPYQNIRQIAAEVLQNIEFNDEQKIAISNKILTDAKFEHDPLEGSGTLIDILIDTDEIIPLFQDVLVGLVYSRISDPPMPGGYAIPLGAAYPSWGVGYPVATTPPYTSMITSSGSADADLLVSSISILRQTAILSLAKIAPESIDNQHIDHIIGDLQKNDDPIPVVTGKISIDQSIENQRKQKSVVIAAYILGQIGPAAHLATDELKKSLETPDEITRIAIAWALTKIAPETERQFALDIIFAAFEQPDPYVRQKVIFALRDIGVVNDQVINILIHSIENEDLQIQFSAIETLAHFGPAAQNAVPFLERTANNPFLPISQAAREALKKIKNHS